MTLTLSTPWSATTVARVKRMGIIRCLKKIGGCLKEIGGFSIAIWILILFSPFLHQWVWHLQPIDEKPLTPMADTYGSAFIFPSLLEVPFEVPIPGVPSELETNRARSELIMFNQSDHWDEGELKVCKISYPAINESIAVLFNESIAVLTFDLTDLVDVKIIQANLNLSVLDVKPGIGFEQLFLYYLESTYVLPDGEDLRLLSASPISPLPFFLTGELDLTDLDLTADLDSCEWNVTSAVDDRQGKLLTMLIRVATAEKVWFSSAETEEAPELVVKHKLPPPAPPGVEQVGATVLAAFVVFLVILAKGCKKKYVSPAVNLTSLGVLLFRTLHYLLQVFHILL